MKRQSVLKFLIVAIISVSSVSLLSCRDNDSYEPIPVKINDVNGNYKGRLVTTQNGKNNEIIVEFTAKDSIVTFKDFPIREIVKTVVTDAAKAEAALAKIGKVEYKVYYKSKINTTQNVVELTTKPNNIVLKVPVDGVDKNVTVKMIAKQKGYYLGSYRSLRFGMEAERITVDGTDVSGYQTIKYEIPTSVKY